MDTRLIEDGTYFVAEAGALLAGCGPRRGRWPHSRGSSAWTRGPSRTRCSTPPWTLARIPAFFVHPDFARRGVGGRILDACEVDAARAGFRRFEIGATAAGERLYRVRGYLEFDRIATPLPNGASMPVIRMAKRI